ncbi:hypothetical protein Lalb_Chr13g0301471 [Lupinus albus]|uniref:Uncharacterized protein n=1 Tax=Lupinus albus TaxID=3870 RepID=A0A6A4PJQ5_LUPAL|nr:hypothetical protein Lalb_Chr13g0301471 [Lupinus albus]
MKDHIIYIKGSHESKTSHHVNDSHNNTTHAMIKLGHGMKNISTSLEKIEAGLAHSRALIQEAVRTRNYTTNIKNSFVPKGSIYWNPHTFHQLSF